MIEKTVIRLKRDLYCKEAVLKAAYHFLDRCYIHLDCIDDDYAIEITAKGYNSLEKIAMELENEVLAQTVRHQVYEQTHTIREILMARAMASTITGTNTELESADIPQTDCDLDSILKDWFETNER